jgi:hypothetical protein
MSDGLDQDRRDSCLNRPILAVLASRQAESGT